MPAQWSWPFIIGTLLYAGGWVLCILMLYIAPRNRDPDAAAGWLIFSFFLPYPAAAVFAVLGSPKLPAARRERQRDVDAFLVNLAKEGATNPKLADVFNQELPVARQSIAALVSRLGGLPVFSGNHVEVLADYTTTIKRITADIDAAQNYVHLLYYIFADDEQGRAVAAAVCRAAQRGVTCRVLYDSLGNHSYRGTLVKQLSAAGVDVHPVLPLRLIGKDRRRPDLRNHRKIAVIDGMIAYTGSQNLVDPVFKPGIVYEELVARVRGPVVLQFAAVFGTDWFSETNMRIPSDPPTEMDALLPPTGSVACQVLPSGPAYDTDNVAQLFAAMLYSARHRAVLTTPYFIPNGSLFNAIQNAALRGVDVHLIVSAQGDQFLVSHAQRSYYESMLASGVKIYAVRSPTFIHAKHLSIDDDLSVIGSSNFDVRSFRLNLEVVLLSYNADVVGMQRRVEASYMERADMIDLEEWRARPRWQQFIDNTCRLVSALL